MLKLALLAGCAAVCAVPLAAQSGTDLKSSVEAQLPALTETYKHLHRNPELSHFEKETSAYLAGELREAGFKVTEHVGKYPDGTKAYGIVATFENGPGPRLLIRSDMDALPVQEKTGLDYASTVRTKNAQGQDVGVMHACGHDIHMSVLLGTAREMVKRKRAWHGTLMLIGQPSEETVDGARAMLADGLYQRFGRPDFILAEHDNWKHAVGAIGMHAGPIYATSTSVDVTMRGVGSHGSTPQLSKDPIVMAAEFVVQAQSIVARQLNPQEPAVLTIGTIHGGTKGNIIGEEVTMGLTLRSYDDKVRDKMIEAIKRTAEGIAVGYGVPQERMPIVDVSKTEFTPVTVNDAAFTERMRKVAQATLGADHVEEAEAVMGSEDEGLFSQQGRIPNCMWSLGVSDPEKLADSRRTGVPLPGQHSPLFAPVYGPGITTGVETMTAMAMDVMK
jgi:hippurate hydrolase